jgi:hypothetical protein
MAGVPTQSSTGLIGANIAYVQTVADLALGSGQPMYPVLTTTMGKKTKAVWAKVTEAITGDTATCAISAAGAATATLGTYLSPATTLANGDYAWFTQDTAA